MVLINRRKLGEGAGKNGRTVFSVRPGAVGGRQVLPKLRGHGSAGESHLSLLRQGHPPRPALSALRI